MRTRAMMTIPCDRAMIAPRRMDARPVTVMHPEMMPAMPQATTTVIELLVPFSKASRIQRKERDGLSPLSSSSSPSFVNGDDLVDDTYDHCDDD